MTPTPDQTRAGWTTLPDRETWDAHVARGGVWMWQDGTDLYVRRSPQYPPPQTYTDCIWLPADPTTYAYCPLPGAVPVEPGPTVECQDLIEYVDIVCDDMTDDQFEGACKALKALWDDFDFVRRKRG